MRLRFVFRRLQFFRIYENLSAEHVSTFLLSAPFPVYGCSLFELSVRQSFRPSTVALFPSRSSALQPLINRSEGREASATGAETTKCLAHTIIIAVVSLCVGHTNLVAACLAFEARLGGGSMLYDYKFPALFPPLLPVPLSRGRERGHHHETPNGLPPSSPLILIFFGFWFVVWRIRSDSPQPCQPRIAYPTSRKGASLGKQKHLNF